MGQTIEALGIQQGHTFPVVIDENNQEDLNSGKLKGIDAIIEFTVPAAAPANIKKCIDLGIPVVSGTTGWNEKVPEIEAYCIENDGTFFYASNFSVGVNILFSLNRKLAEIMDQFPDYKADISEVHHVHKKDAPSGTAISLAEQVLELNRNYKRWHLKGQDDPGENPEAQLPIEAFREGEVKGLHSVQYVSALDTITLRHDAHTRDAFATGSLLAASFIIDKIGVFGMQDLLKL